MQKEKKKFLKYSAEKIKISKENFRPKLIGLSFQSKRFFLRNCAKKIFNPLPALPKIATYFQ